MPEVEYTLEALAPSVPVMQIMVLDVEFESKWLEEGRGGGRGHASTQARMAHRFRVGNVGRAYPLHDRERRSRYS